MPTAVARRRSREPQSVDLDPPAADGATGREADGGGRDQLRHASRSPSTRERAPRTANSFAYLARQAFYDGLAFHRISPELRDPGRRPDRQRHRRPRLQRRRAAAAEPRLHARRGRDGEDAAEPPGRSGSQFFIVTGADAGLPPDYALLGRVSRGFDVVERIAALGTRSGRPTQTVLTEKVTIERG